MKRAVVVAAIAAPLLVIPTTAFADVGSSLTGTVSGTTSTVTSTVAPSGSTTSAGDTSTSGSTLTSAVSTVTSTVSTVTGATTAPQLVPAPTTLTDAAPAASSSTLALPAGTTSPSATATASPAPDGTAEAYAANVSGVIAIAHSSATATSDQSKTSSTADPLELGGQTVVGGTAKGANDHKNGTLLGAGDNPLAPLGLAAMPYDARTQTQGDTWTATSSASLLTLMLPSALFLDVLHSESTASYTQGSPDTSSGSTTSYGLHLVAGSDKSDADCSDNSCLSLYLLYAHTDSSGKGSAYIANVNGNQIVDNQQVGGQCDIPLNPLIELICVYAKAGTGSLPTETAAVLTGTSQSGLPAIGVVTGSSTPAKGTTATVPASQQQGATVPGRSGNPGQSGNAGQTGGQSGNAGQSGSAGRSGNQGTEVAPAATGPLPFTGFDARLVALLALLLVGCGVAVRRTGRPLA